MSGGDFARVRVIIPTGLGLNCEEETAHAFRTLGCEPELVHLTDLFTRYHHQDLAHYHVLALIGGFAYGDHIGAGFVLATRLRAKLQDDLGRFLEKGGLVLGICNGFQTLVRLGLLPGPDEGNHDFVPRAALAPNDRLGYRNAWVRLGVDAKTHCLWTRGTDEIELPARHGEGKFVVESDDDLTRLERSGRIALRYLDPEGRPTERWPHNPNGSHRGVAGVTDASGRVLGLMPHPDAFLHPWHHPRAHAEAGEGREPVAQGLSIFRAGLEAAKELV